MTTDLSSSDDRPLRAGGFQLCLLFSPLKTALSLLAIPSVCLFYQPQTSLSREVSQALLFHTSESGVIELTPDLQGAVLGTQLPTSTGASGSKEVT